MFNHWFKADFGYNSFTNGDDSKSFDYWILQKWPSLGRIMNFRNLDNTIGLLGHAGFGLSF
jgi:OOP family OmpA-OmpF porin